MALFQRAECHHIETRFPVPVLCLTHVKSNKRELLLAHWTHDYVAHQIKYLYLFKCLTFFATRESSVVTTTSINCQHLGKRMRRETKSLCSVAGFSINVEGAATLTSSQYLTQLQRWSIFNLAKGSWQLWLLIMCDTFWTHPYHICSLLHTNS